MGTARRAPPIRADRVGREVSARAVIAVWEAVRRRGLDPTKLAVGTGYSAAQLTNRNERISWAGFHRLMSNLGDMLDDEALVEIGRETIESPFFRALALPGRHLFGAPDVYRWCFAPNGPAMDLFTVCDGTITSVGHGRLRFDHWVKQGYEPSRENLLVLKGTLIAIGTALGARSPTHSVSMQLTARGACFDIRVPARAALFDLARRVAGPVASWVRAGSDLRDAHSELYARYEELEREVNRRIQVESELRSSDERYRQLFDRVPLPMFLFDLDTLAILGVNKAAIRHYGYSRDEWMRMTIADIRPPEDVPALMHDLGQHIDSPRVWRHRKRDGSVILVEIATQGIALEGRRASIVVVNDVTARVHVEERLREAEKVEAVGRLAGGVAHDFNNLLTVILGSRDLETIRAAAERGVELTRRLLVLSHRQLHAQAPLDLGEVMRDMHKLVLAAINRDDIRVIVSAARPVSIVGIDRESVERVIMNLVINARDAMPAGGTLILDTALVELDEDTCRQYGAAAPGPYAIIAVSDTGHGIDAATKARMFEPYFTTKPAGRGTGLGLATVMSIVEQARGHVRVDSVEGRGTRFEIYLPLEPAPRV